MKRVISCTWWSRGYPRNFRIVNFSSGYVPDVLDFITRIVSRAPLAAYAAYAHQVQSDAPAQPDAFLAALISQIYIYIYIYIFLFIYCL